MSTPLLPGALDLLTEPGSYRQPPLQWQFSLEDWGARFGWLLLLLLPAWLQGAKQAEVSSSSWWEPPPSSSSCRA